MHYRHDLRRYMTYMSFISKGLDLLTGSMNSCTLLRLSYSHTVRTRLCLYTTLDEHPNELVA